MSKKNNRKALSAVLLALCGFHRFDYCASLAPMLDETLTSAKRRIEFTVL